MCKATEMEDFPSRRGGTLGDNGPIALDVKSGQMFWWNREFWQKNCPLTTTRLMLYSSNSAAIFWPIRPRRGGRAAECGGLLNLGIPQDLPRDGRRRSWARRRSARTCCPKRVTCD